MKNTGRLGEYFRYHGWLSPGVRWFRQSSFKAKASVIALVFMIPLAVTLAQLWQSAGQGITVATAERQGLTYLRPVLDFIQLAQTRRLAATLQPADLPALQSPLDAAFERIRVQHHQSGAVFVDQAAYDAFQQRHEALRNTPVAASPDDTLQAHTDLIDAALKLVASVADTAQLSLDPDLDTFHMMNVSVIRGPRQTENTARINAMGQLILHTAENSPHRHEQMTRWAAVQRLIDDEVESSYQIGIGQDPTAARLFDMVGTDKAFDAFMSSVQQQVMGASLQGDRATYARLGDAVAAKQNELNGQVLEELDRRLQARIDRLAGHRNLQVAISLCFVTIALYLMLAFYRVMIGGLNEVASHLQEISKGNLTTAPRPWGTDEAAQLMLSLREMQTSLQRTVGVVIDSASQVHTSSNEIATAAADLAVRTEQAAVSLQQTTATMQHIAEAAALATNTVDAATRSVQDSAAVAARGGKVVAEVVRTMEDIRQASTRISEIISAIDGIAFQTNILALNAAVEASRAGEHGRGFAVVATEVRALAGRSATAAKEIKTLVNSSLTQVRNGTTVVTDAGQIMQNIVTNADKVARQIHEIAEAARVQQRSMVEMSTAVSELDQSTQQNAMLVEQSSNASYALAEQARHLSDEVGQFKLPALTP
ncbi:methyl-accepting chemotaxis protein [Sphaerotilus sp.]|uniref:methyl-accepting chemotaxis protein n=1 Tax=Sphaerotilus sp. TaxID=2093942 RepID=UPI002ACD8017|nr:methyl-accepting chemotaxis protein [Sphaerotilus sp.]MDZ7856940.1 methyl-accepting chemotaxis protein [Sphaerotilus sp.]